MMTTTGPYIVERPRVKGEREQDYAGGARFFTVRCPTAQAVAGIVFLPPQI